MLVLIVLILADVRVFQGSSVASFTLYELFVWGYCTPFIIGRMLGSLRPLMPARARFVSVSAAYLAWILFASLFALWGRQHSDVLQQAKNILPTLPLICFVSLKVQRIASVARLANVYVLYCIAACVLAILQHQHGGPYLRPPVENNEYKLDFSGGLVENVALGFSNTPNELAVVVLPGVMFSAIKLVYELREKRRPRLLTLACCLVTGTGFLLAQSRGAVIWFLFGFALFVSPLRHSRSFALKVVLAAGLIVLVVGYGLYHAPASNGDVENTVAVRYLLWKTSVDAAASDLYVALLGDGMPYVQAWSWHNAGWEFPDAHNGWIDQALFFGIPALLLYLAIWRRFFAITDGAADFILPSGRVLLDGIRGSVLALMGLSFFEPVAHSVFPVSQLFLLMSCGVCLASLPSEQPPKSRRDRVQTAIFKPKMRRYGNRQC